jgi:hypothetical protein
MIANTTFTAFLSSTYLPSYLKIIDEAPIGQKGKLANYQVDKMAS